MPKKKRKKAKAKKRATFVLPDVPEIQKVSVQEKHEQKNLDKLLAKVSPKAMKGVLPVKKIEIVHNHVEALIHAQGGRELLWKPVGTEPEVLDRFCKWLSDNGGGFGLNERWKIGRTHYGRGLVALRDLPEGEPLLEIPQELFFSSQKARDCKKHGALFQTELLQNNPSLTVVAFLLLHSIDPNSFWRPYIDALPRTDCLLPSFTCTPDDLRILETVDVSDDIAKLLVNHLQLYCALRQIFDKANCYPPLRWYDYAWAASMVMTRQSSIEVDSTGMITLIPGHDFVNCRQQGQSNSSFDGKILRLMAEQSTASGEEVLMNYGVRNSKQTLCNNGFVCEGNVHDAFHFILGLDQEDPLLRVKRLQLQKKGIIRPKKNYVSIFVPVTSAQIPELLLEFARIQALGDREEVVQYMKKSDVGVLNSENELKAWKSLSDFFQREIESADVTVKEDMSENAKLFLDVIKVNVNVAQRVFDLVKEGLKELESQATDS